MCVAFRLITTIKNYEGNFQGLGNKIWCCGKIHLIDAYPALQEFVKAICCLPQLDGKAMLLRALTMYVFNMEKSGAT